MPPFKHSIMQGEEWAVIAVLFALFFIVLLRVFFRPFREYKNLVPHERVSFWINSGAVLVALYAVYFSCVGILVSRFYARDSLRTQVPYVSFVVSQDQHVIVKNFGITPAIDVRFLLQDENGQIVEFYRNAMSPGEMADIGQHHVARSIADFHIVNGVRSCVVTTRKGRRYTSQFDYQEDGNQFPNFDQFRCD